MGNKDKAKATQVKRITKTKDTTFQLIQNIDKWAATNGKTAKTSLLNSYLGQLNSHYQTFMLKHEELCMFSDDDDDGDEKEDNYMDSLIEMEEVFTSAKAMLSELIEERKPAIVVPTCSNNVPLRTVIKLPKLQPPKFSGNYYDWVDFKNEFKSMIIDCNDVTDVDRFRFLKSCLTGNALQSISKMEASNDNFQIAWGALVDRYENKALIFQSHVNEIIQVSATKKESACDLREMLDKVKAHHRALSSLGNMENLADNLLICLISSKLDQNTVMKWEETTSKEIPTWIDFTAFLEKRACTLEKIDWNKKQTQKATDSSEPSTSHASNRRRSTHSALITTNSVIKCLKCNSTEHDVKSCTEFIAMDPTDRSKLVRDAKICILCLQSNHRTRYCKALRCDKCGGRHHSLVHWTQANHSTEVIASTSQATMQRALVTSESIGDEPALLATAVVNAVNRNGEAVPCRAILDCAATTNFISYRCAQMLGIDISRKAGSVGGIGNNVVKLVSNCALKLKSRFYDFENFDIHAAVLPKIMDSYPPIPINIGIEIPHDINLADPEFEKPQQIDLLIGAGLFWELLLDDKINIGPNLPHLRKTKFGWIVSGPLPPKNPHRVLACVEEGVKDECIDNLDNLVKRFWEIDTLLPTKTILSPRDQECEDHYDLHTRRDETGRYIVRLPFLCNGLNLGQSIGVAMRRFLNLEKKLDKNPIAKELYVEFINEYQQLGHLQELSNFDSAAVHYFLPHHCVLKPLSSSTKLRVVFDASCKTSTGVSLNDLLHSGPKLQDDLFVILLRFRLFRYVLTGDIQKMFREVCVDEKDTNYQLILWRSSSSEPIKILRLCTVTYGTAPGSYLAIKTLQRLADDEEHNFTLGARTLRKTFYVDDMMAGSNSIEELQDIMSQTSSILLKGGFKMSKFCSNEFSILDEIDKQHREKFLSINDNDVIKVLGLIWQPDSDVFHFTHQHIQTSSQAITKRTVLSDMARLFDPLGLICPVITLAKIFYQDLWKLKCSWDKQLSEELSKKWIKFKVELSSMKNVSIPRYVMSQSSYTHLEIHGFSDASEKAYGACVYVRCCHINMSTSVHLLCAKSKVAPTKTLSIARLELLAAKLLSDLVLRLKGEVLNELKIDAEYYWTDSMITLCWITSEPHNWNTFVAHRVSKIQQNTQIESWRHVPGEINPADLISRGMLPTDIASSTFWFFGPDFLKQREQHWPPLRIPRDPNEETDEKKPIKIALLATPADDATSSMNFSTNYGGIRRTFSYAMRFIKNSQTSKEGRLNRHSQRRNILSTNSKMIYNQIETPTLVEQDAAEQRFIQSIQVNAFNREYLLLKKNQPVLKIWHHS